MKRQFCFLSLSLPMGVAPIGVVAFMAILAFATPAKAGSITCNYALSGSCTGPTGDYFLSSGGASVWVVQGTSIVEHFATSYDGGQSEVQVAISNNTIYTHGSGPCNGIGNGGQYSLTGARSGVLDPYVQPTGQSSGCAGDNAYDGTSDGTHNYYVEAAGIASAGGNTENLFRTDLNGGNPTLLFSVQSNPGAAFEYEGISYDSANHSLWVSGYSNTQMVDYSMTGAVLSSFTTADSHLFALGFDSTDGTLWTAVGGSNTLEQFSTSGTLLQSVSYGGLPGGFAGGEFAELGGSDSSSVPEPGTIALFGTGAALVRWVRRRLKSRT